MLVSYLHFTNDLNQVENLSKVGKLFFAISTVAFGIEHFINGNFPSALMPVPVFPLRNILVYVVGPVFVLSGVCIVAKVKSHLAALVVAAVFTPFLLVHLVKLFSNIYDPGPWTAGFEIVALMGGALLLANSSDAIRGANKITSWGRFIFATPLIVFGVQHFMYAQFVSFLIPEWIPARLFFAYFVGVAFVATAISIFINVKVQLSTTLLGIMFFIWVLFLHTPRVIANVNTETEWTSFFVALAMSGISFMLADKPPK